LQYEKPRVSNAGNPVNLIQSFGGTFKNPSIADTQSDGTICPAGLCPSEADE